MPGAAAPPARLRRAAWLALLEAIAARSLERAPEPALDVGEFDDAGRDGGVLESVYLVNAVAAHALAPQGCTVVDLGCGPGRYLAFLAARRPDLRFIGLDLDPNMLDLASRLVRERGLENRVELRCGDMTRFAREMPATVGLVSAIFSLHHLPDYAALRACLENVREVRSRSGAAVWLFDHARPKRRATAELFPEIFSPDAGPAFKLSSTNSLIAAWTFEELCEALQPVEGVESSLARALPLYQIHWAEGPVPVDLPQLDDPGIDPRALGDAWRLAALFR